MEEMRSFGYICPKCGKAVLGSRSAFALQAAAARITGSRAFTVLQAGGLMTPMVSEDLPCQDLADKGKPTVMAVLDDVVEELIF